MTTEKFYYTVGDTEIVLPHFANLPFGVIRKTRSLPEDEKFFVILETLMPEGSAEMDALDSLNPTELEEFVKAWQAESDVSLGESKASKRSTKSTKRP